MPIQSVIIPKTAIHRQAKVEKPQADILLTPENYTGTRKFIGNETTGYYPILSKMTEEDKFDYELAKGTKLKNGATLIRPIILSLGEVKIDKMDDGKYKIKSSKSDQELIMSEPELLDTKWLARGMIKKLGNNKFAIRYTDENN